LFFLGKCSTTWSHILSPHNFLNGLLPLLPPLKSDFFFFK
jgi:hypothetical protein